MTKNIFNKFFNKIFVINLYDKIERWKKVEKQFSLKKIKVDRFIAIDGRCKKEGESVCKSKLKTFQIMYNIKISNKDNYKINELLPAASLTIGTILLLRHMVKNNLERILICEDDIELTTDLEKTFSKGIKEIGDATWDILYLGCGGDCGIKGINYDYTEETPYLSEVGQILDDEYYISVKEDLRSPCDIEDCREFSKHISYAKRPGGTWAYAYSLRGAKKLLKLINNDAGNHIDQIVKKFVDSGDIKALAFDPPIIYHEGGAIRTNSDIGWSW